MPGSKFYCTMIPRKGNRKDATREVYDRYGAIVIARVKWKADARMCVLCRGYKTHEEERGKENCCTCDRFSADGFRTRAARVIRWLVLGVRAIKGKTGKEGTGRPADSRTREKRGVCAGVRSVSAWRGPEGRFTLPHS